LKASTRASRRSKQRKACFEAFEVKFEAPKGFKED
jgi:hypothetical protein